ncbi:MAG: 30S ribosomal protein S17 [Chloroflexi bacterium]|nr:30S ribosomal protein S17 [Chloroflexota bacterium]
MAVETPQRGSMRKTKVGTVVSDKMDKTVVVAVDHFRRHPLYGRQIRRTRRFKAHDPDNACRVGDQVEIMESRPLSKDKHWVVTQILRRATTEVGPAPES